MFSMNVLKSLSSIVLILVLLNSIHTNTAQTGKEVDCTTSYRMWELPYEDFESYCFPKFCKCFTDIEWNITKPIETDCPPEWSKDLFDGLAMIWYMKNRDYTFLFDCNTDKRRIVSLKVWTDVQKTHILVRSYYPHMYGNRRLLNKAGGSEGTDSHLMATFYLSNSEISPRLNTKGLWDVKMSINNSDRLENEDNVHPSSFKIVVYNKTKSAGVLMDTIIFGPFGGRENLRYGPYGKTMTYFQFDFYTDMSRREGYEYEIQPIFEGKAYQTGLNPFISRITTSRELYICLGRKINPKTNRTHWTGEGCLPQKVFQKAQYGGYNTDYTIECNCVFESLGLNAPDDDPNRQPVPGFNEIDDDTAYPPLSSLEQQSEEEDKASLRLAFYYSLILLIVCLVLIVVSIGLLVYHKNYQRN